MMRSLNINFITQRLRMDNIKIIRLQSGEDIIASYKESDGEGTVLLGNPMTFQDPNTVITLYTKKRDETY